LVKLKEYKIILTEKEIKMCQGAMDWIDGGLILWTSEHDLLARILRQIVADRPRADWDSQTKP
tara:strand:- start:198 stop:386 length:189 start_codon:yes stop_codon:yes gene_type:complete